MDVTPQTLRLIAACYRRGSVTQVALELGITQPAASMQLARAEKALGFPLFERTARGITPTVRGRILCEAAEAALAGLRSWERTAEAMRREDEHVLRVGSIAYGGGDLMTRILADFGRAHPSVTLQREQCGFEDHLGGLRTGTADVAFGFGAICDDGIEAQTLFLDPPVIAVATNTRWARRKSISVYEILDEPLLSGGDPGDGWEDYWLARPHRVGHAPTVAGVYTTPELHLDAVARGVGLSIMSVQTQLHYRHSGVAYVPLRGVAPVRHWLAWPREHPSRYVAELVACARRAAAGAGAGGEPAAAQHPA
jgi:DNA-binding transcriptional LysR family regulator